MKKFIYIILFSSLILGCNEDQFLKETPLDFMSASNSYSTAADFNTAVTELYYLVRKEFYGDYNRNMDYIYATDMMICADPLKSNLASDFDPTGSVAKSHWDNLYLLIAQSNVIISRLPKSQLTEKQQVLYEAKARFFRGFAYRTLAYLYGGVPITLEEITSPKTDFVRASKEETLNQAITDVEFAAENLNDITDVSDGEISSPAAYHLLAELYLATGEYDKAVTAADKVINNSALSLMKTRFGSRSSEPGDVYWDLFRMNNQNRKSGNTEGIWVIQEEADVLGGGAKTSEYFWSTNSYWLERYCAPQVGLFKFVLPDGTNLSPFTWPTGDYTGGRGIGTLYADNHFYREIWESDFDNDIRNSKYNFPRKFKFNNSDFIKKYGAVFGDSIDLENPQLPEGVTIVTGYSGGVAKTNELPNRFLCGYQTKCTTPFNHPAAQYLNKGTYLLSGTAGKTYTDQYMFRLAETYLLRAEAYLKLNNKEKAAADINMVRSRAKASPVKADEVNIDYILDERLRELGIEEKRRLTLARTGEMYRRVTTYNPYYNSSHSADGKGFQEKYILYPIPQSAIEANKDAALEQNPGY